MTSEFDIIVYGASGFASRFIIQKLMTHNIKLALGGRNSDRILANVKEINLGDRIPIFEADVSNIDFITSKTKILINCAGPYIFSGEEIVESCIRNKTHYLDITGETFFIERCIKKYGVKAKEEGVFIINCCGFDSLPADIGVELLKETIKKENEEIAKNQEDKENKKVQKIEIESILVLENCFINKTTYDSAVYGFGLVKETQKMRKENNTHSNLNKKKVKKLFFDKEMNQYCTLFPGTDASVVKKSQTLFVKELNDVHCDYFAYIQVGNRFKTFLLSLFSMIFYLNTLTAFGRYLLIKFSYLFTLGKIKGRRPSSKEISKGKFKFHFRSTVNTKEYKMMISGPDPGYITTAICVSEAAVLLLEMINNGEGNNGVGIFKGGVLTPACVLYGSDIVERLRFNGIIFEIVNK